MSDVSTLDSLLATKRQLDTRISASPAAGRRLAELTGTTKPQFARGPVASKRDIPRVEAATTTRGGDPALTAAIGLLSDRIDQFEAGDRLEQKIYAAPGQNELLIGTAAIRAAKRHRARKGK